MTKIAKCIRKRLFILTDVSSRLVTAGHILLSVIKVSIVFGLIVFKRVLVISTVVGGFLLSFSGNMLTVRFL